MSTNNAPPLPHPFDYKPYNIVYHSQVLVADFLFKRLRTNNFVQINFLFQCYFTIVKIAVLLTVQSDILLYLFNKSCSSHFSYTWQKECRTFWPRTFRPWAFRLRFFAKVDVSAKQYLVVIYMFGVFFHWKLQSDC